ncbi:hypothetical protein H1Q59_04810 [Holosporaceae bacterium 'Namur']|nr:hypothetical protein [Holosporaceae bacterium 'Namur']
MSRRGISSKRKQKESKDKNPKVETKAKRNRKEIEGEEEEIKVNPKIAKTVEGHLNEISSRSQIRKDLIPMKALKKMLDEKKISKAYIEETVNNYFDKFKAVKVLEALSFSKKDIESTRYAALYIEESRLTPEKKIKEALQSGDGDTIKKFTQEFYKYLHELNAERESRDLDWEERRFDSLSRLLVSDINDCAAVCFNGEKILYAFNHLHGSSSDVKRAHIKEHAVKVFKYFTNCVEGNYEKPEKKQKDRMKIIVDTCCTALQLKEEEDKGRIQNIIHLLDEYHGKLPEEIKGAVNFKELNQAIRTRKDLMKVEEALTTGDKKFNNNIINSFKAGNKGSELIEEGETNDKCHAEMRIVEHLLDEQPNIKGKLDKIYIGLSKLCCAHCHLVITNDPSDPLMLEYQDDEGKAIKVPIYTRGHHGQSFEWFIINKIKVNDGQLKHFLGKEAFEIYQEMEEKGQDLALYVVVQEIGTLTSEQLGKVVGIKIKSHHTSMGSSSMQYADNSPSDIETDVKARTWRSTIEEKLTDEGLTKAPEEQIDFLIEQAGGLTDILEKFELHKLYAEKIISFMQSESFKGLEYNTANIMEVLGFSIDKMNKINHEADNEHYTQDIKHFEIIANISRSISQKEYSRGYQEGLNTVLKEHSSSKDITDVEKGSSQSSGRFSEKVLTGREEKDRGKGRE